MRFVLDRITLGIGITLSVYVFPVSIIPPIFHSHLNVTNTLITRRIWRKLRFFI